MYFNIDISEKTKNRICEIVQEQIDELVLKDDEFIKKLVKESISGAVKCRINEIVQSINFRNELRDRILKQLNLDNLGVKNEN